MRGRNDMLIERLEFEVILRGMDDEFQGGCRRLEVRLWSL